MEEKIKKNQEKGIKKLSKRHREVIELIVEGNFPTDRELAEFVGIAPETLSRWKNTDIFAEELERRLTEEDRYRRMRYRARANRAAERLFEIMDSFTNPKLAMQATLKVLELAGDVGGAKEEETEQGSFGVVVLPSIQSVAGDSEYSTDSANGFTI